MFKRSNFKAWLNTEIFKTLYHCEGCIVLMLSHRKCSELVIICEIVVIGGGSRAYYNWTFNLNLSFHVETIVKYYH